LTADFQDTTIHRRSGGIGVDVGQRHGALAGFDQAIIVIVAVVNERSRHGQGLSAVHVELRAAGLAQRCTGTGHANRRVGCNVDGIFKIVDAPGGCTATIVTAGDIAAVQNNPGIEMAGGIPAGIQHASCI